MATKNKAKKASGALKKDDRKDKDSIAWEDLELLLGEEKAKDKVAMPVTNTAEEPQSSISISTTAATRTTVDDSVAVGEADGDGEGDGEGESNDKSVKDKKKKKKKGKKDEEATKEPTPTPSAPISAAGKAIMLRRQQQAEEEARVKALQEAEERRIRELEEAEEAARQAVINEKERKRKAKQDKIALQKAEGTYMTKSEKEKARKNQERLELMKAAGLIIAKPNEQTKVVYSHKKKTQQHPKESQPSALNDDEDSSDEGSVDDIQEKSSPIAVDKTVVEEISSLKEALPSASDNKGGDDWEDDDWESSIDNIADKIAELSTSKILSIEAEDLLEFEQKAEKDRIKQLGIARLKRDEEARLKREMEERERAELDRQARELAMRKEISKSKRIQREVAAKSQRSPDHLRAAISVIMGHVDTGKTKLLDKIRNTNVQEGEAGGITQQIGATHFPRETLAIQTNAMQEKSPFELKLPGLLVIDTPGHESFTNLRNRGSSLCDVAILVIDLMHGLEPQTIESINLLRRKNAPFIVALNKVDRLYGWKKLPDGPIRDALALQDENCISEFKDRSDNIILQLNELGLNAKMYWENDSISDTVSLVPTSAMSGEGVPDLLMNVIRYAQEQIHEKLMYYNYLQCTVLEVKIIDGLGPSIDVVLLNGSLHEGDRIVVSTMDGPIITQVRALLTPPPNREMRIKSEYIHHQSVLGAMGVKIVAPDLTRTVAGTSLMVIHPDDDEEELMEDVQSDFASVTKISTDSKGVTVHASTLGALEALLQFLQKECKPTIPVSTVSIGTIFKRDVMKAAIMNEKGLPEYATILAFDVKLDAEVQAYADELNVRIFTADIIYHLFDQFSAFMNNLMETRRAEALGRAVYPCVLKIFPQHIFNKKDPIVMGVEVIEGTLKVQTPLYIPQIGLDIGRVTSIENNHKEVNQAKKGTSVSIKISCESNPNLMYGRQFDHTHSLYSKISRDSIDALKEFFKEEVSKEDWILLVKLKKVFNISDQAKSKKTVVAVKETKEVKPDNYTGEFEEED